MSAILQDISEKLQKGKMKEVAELVKQAVADGIQPLTILNEGLMPGMDIIGERFKKNDIFIPEVLIAARAMAAGTDVLRPLLVGDQMEEKGTVVIGTIKDDLHDIGKNLVRMMMESKGLNVIDLGKLEYCVREDLNKVAQRRMAVLNPLKVVITNYDENKTELFTAINNPEDETAGTRQVPFSKVIYIERDDFMEEPPKKFFRLSPGGEVRLRYSYLIKCEEVIKDAEGNVTELRCTYDPMSGQGSSSDGRRVKGVIHWVSAKDAVEAEIRLFNPLFTKENPDDVEEGQTWEDNLNPESMVRIKGYLEPSLRDVPVGQAVQFERVGYFCPDTDSTPEHLVFNRTVTLKDSWAKINK